MLIIADSSRFDLAYLNPMPGSYLIERLNVGALSHTERT
jgi:hypothetical protein